jgi:hypothetical protein
MPMYFGKEERNGQSCHGWDSRDCCCDLHVDLVAEKFGMSCVSFIKDQDIAQAGCDEIGEETEDPA